MAVEYQTRNPPCSHHNDNDSKTECIEWSWPEERSDTDFVALVLPAVLMVVVVIGPTILLGRLVAGISYHCDFRKLRSGTMFAIITYQRASNLYLQVTVLFGVDSAGFISATVP